MVLPSRFDAYVAAAARGCPPATTHHLPSRFGAYGAVAARGCPPTTTHRIRRRPDRGPPRATRTAVPFDAHTPMMQRANSRSVAGSPGREAAKRPQELPHSAAHEAGQMSRLRRGSAIRKIDAARRFSVELAERLTTGTRAQRWSGDICIHPSDYPGLCARGRRVRLAYLGGSSAFPVLAHRSSALTAAAPVSDPRAARPTRQSRQPAADSPRAAGSGSP